MGNQPAKQPAGETTMQNAIDAKASEAIINVLERLGTLLDAHAQFDAYCAERDKNTIHVTH